MPATIIIGSQWGDEGKGKIVDLLAENYDLIVRFQGGNNAGHTVVHNNETFKFHLLPSGILQGKRCLLASGVVIDPKVLLGEIETAKENGFSINLGIDKRAAIIMPYHILLDKAREKALNKPIGTTGRGIGPCYEDKAARRAVLFSELIDQEKLKKKLKIVYPEKQGLLENVYNEQLEQEQQILEEYMEYGKQLKHYLADVSLEITDNNYLKILYEGAQGTFLDVAFGTYPYVTSSHTIAANAFVQAGIPAEKAMIIGVTKAYTTRVGSGPFVTELNQTISKNEDKLIGEFLLKAGNEFGTTTGRARRCGWLDLVMLKESARLNGFTHLAITKLDVLSTVEKLKVCIAYVYNGEQLATYPETEILEQCTPIYKEFNGFILTKQMIENKTLPDNAMHYLQFMQEYLGIPITLVSIGAERKETIFLEKE